jgi:hypothetical protein
MRGKPFQLGNKFGRGRPPGSRNKVASALQQTLEVHAETLTKKCAQLALQGNTTAMRLCMERLLPARRQRVLQFKLPAIKTINDLATASETVVRGVTRGLLTPGEGQAFTVMLDGRRRMIETQELEVRLRALEEGRNKL